MIFKNVLSFEEANRMQPTNVAIIKVHWDVNKIVLFFRIL